MWRIIWVFSALVVAVWLLIRIGRIGYYQGSLTLEWLLGGLALLFLLLGIGLQRLSLRPKPVKGPDRQKVAQLGLTPREYEVLLALCDGLSNREIASRLFITESTVKTHVSNLLLKLDVKRRTQLIGRAKALHLLPETTG